MKSSILFVTPVNLGYPGGAEKWLYEVIIRLRKRGHEVSVLYTACTPVKVLVIEMVSSLSKDINIYKCRTIFEQYPPCKHSSKFTVPL